MNSRRAFSSVIQPTKDDIWHLSRGKVGRKVFTKGWKHLTPRYPINLQERWHRAAIERLFHPSIIENVGSSETGDRDTMEYRMFFHSNNIDTNDEYNKLSPWHDIPLGFKVANEGNGQESLYFNYINEIDKLSRAKMECCLTEKWNPIKQDIKKGKLRYFTYGDLPFNYGFISQTFENPHYESEFSDIKGLKGDGDPIDVVEISETSIARGNILPIKVLSVLGLVDEGETDWKIIGIRADHPKCDAINDMKQAKDILGIDFEHVILDWFRNYKTTDGKPVNSFSHNEVFMPATMAIDVIEECHRHWLDLILSGNKEYDLTSVTQKHLTAQGLTSDKSDIANLPKIEYPRYDDWRAIPAQRIEDIDNSRDEFELDEEAPDQRKR